MGKWSGVCSAALAVAFLGAPAAANAQAASGPSSSGEGAGGSNEIIVTAQKKSEPLLSVPVPVSAVLASDLLGQNQTQLQDFFSKVPGLSLLSSGSGQTTIAIRGISTSSSSNPTVGIVIDDVPFGASSVTAYSSRLIPDLDPSDLAQIEVLRGPQGTLYGASSIGGLLKYVTVDPSMKGFSGRVQGDLSSVSHGEVGYGLRGAMNVPLSDDLAVRVSAFGRHDPGYVDNVTTGKRNVNAGKAYGGRVALLWSPTDSFSWKVSALAQNRDGDGTAEIETDSALRPTLGAYQQARLPDSGQFESRVRFVSSSIAADLGFADLAFLTGFGRNEYRSVFDYTPALGTDGTFANDYATNKFTQEVRLSRSFGDLLDVIVGGYYGRERTKGQQALNVSDPDTGAAVANLITINSRTNLDEVAVFGAATLHFGAFSIQAGGRYTHNTQSYPRSVVGGGSSDIHAKSSPATFLISPQYKFSENAMLYARVASGYRIGGPNPNAAAGAPPSYAPDKASNYELGFKGTFFDRVLTLDTSLFYIDWKNIQLSFNNPVTHLTYFTNGPKAKSAGVEATMTLAPTRGFTITAAGAYNVAELTEALPTGGGYGLDGDRLPFSSRFSGSVAVDNRIPLDDSTDLVTGMTLTYVGDRYGDFQSSSALIRTQFPSYATVDLRLGLENGPWMVNGFLSNATNERGIIGGGARGPALVGQPFSVVYIRPRTLGVSVARTF
jgi:Outer membrane receptor proteins, mostly Fe transport